MQIQTLTHAHKFTHNHTFTHNHMHKDIQNVMYISHFLLGGVNKMHAYPFMVHVHVHNVPLMMLAFVPSKELSSARLQPTIKCTKKQI